MTPQVLQKLQYLETRYDELARLMADPAVQADPPSYRAHAKELAYAQEIVDAYHEYLKLDQQLRDTRELSAGDDEEMKQLAAGEVASLEGSIASLEDRIRTLLVPRDPNDDRNVVLEIRAGT